MKALFYLLLLVAIGYGGCKYYSYHTNEGDVAEFVKSIPGIGGEMSKEFEVSTRQLVVTTRQGKKLYKTYKKKTTYRYDVDDNSSVRKQAKKAAYDKAMKELFEDAKEEISQIREGLSYYRDVDKHLRHLSNNLPTTVYSKISDHSKEARRVLRATSSSYKTLDGKNEKILETDLFRVATTLKRSKNKQAKFAAHTFLQWYENRLDNYPAHIAKLRSFRIKY